MTILQDCMHIHSDFSALFSYIFRTHRVSSNVSDTLARVIKKTLSQVALVA